MQFIKAKGKTFIVEVVIAGKLLCLLCAKINPFVQSNKFLLLGNTMLKLSLNHCPVFLLRRSTADHIHDVLKTSSWIWICDSCGLCKKSRNIEYWWLLLLEIIFFSVRTQIAIYLTLLHHTEKLFENWMQWLHVRFWHIFNWHGGICYTRF